jgi:nicotinamidase-related amidase
MVAFVPIVLFGKSTISRNIIIASSVKTKNLNYKLTIYMNKTNLDLLTPENSVLLLVDYQPAMFKGVGSGNRTIIKNSVLATAKAASILGVKTVLTSIFPKGNGEFIKEITDLFPNQKVIARELPSFDALEDKNVLAAIKATGHNKLVVSGLWTSMCFAFTALHGLREGMDVYGLMDAAGDATPDAHKYGIKRMLQAGVIPITWETITSEWMHDWANPKSAELTKEVYVKYDSMIGM